MEVTNKSSSRELLKKGCDTRTFSTRPSDIKPLFLCVDVKGISLGRAASEVVRYLKGKHKAIYVPHLLCGDHVIVQNLSQIVLTGKKKEQKVYYSHSGHLGGLKERSYEYMTHKDPIFAFRKAVERMMNKCPLRKRMLRMLHIFPGDHNMQAQKPIAREIL